MTPLIFIIAVFAFSFLCFLSYRKSKVEKVSSCTVVPEREFKKNKKSKPVEIEKSFFQARRSKYGNLILKRKYRPFSMVNGKLVQL